MNIVNVVHNMNIKDFFLFTLTFVCVCNTVSSNYEGKICKLTNGIIGECRLAQKCPQTSGKCGKVNWSLYRSCGFDNNNPLICCPEIYGDNCNLDVPNVEIIPPKDTSSKDTSSIDTSPKDTSSTDTSLPIKNERKATKACEELAETVPIPISPQIIQGEIADEGEFPHMAALGYLKDTGLDFDCGGTLISTRYVLTAAHCILNSNRIRPSLVRLGEIALDGNINSSDSDYRVENIVVHPDFSILTKYNDLALLRLNRDVPITLDIHPACLNVNLEDPTTNMTITGWGVTNTAQKKRSDKLLKANVIAVNIRQCNTSYANKERRLPSGITPQQMCAKDPSGKSDTCQGDSGGPLQVAHSTTDGLFTLVGVTSFGRSCATSNPGVYVRVSAYLDWIESVVWP